MGHIDNLEHGEAVKKIQELAMDIRVCMFCTQLDKKTIRNKAYEYYGCGR